MNGTECLVNLLEGRLDLFGVSNITLPCLDLDTVLLGEIGSDVVSVLGRVEDDGNVGGSLGEGLGNGVSDTCKLVPEQGECGKCLRGRGMCRTRVHLQRMIGEVVKKGDERVDLPRLPPVTMMVDPEKSTVW